MGNRALVEQAADLVARTRWEDLPDSAKAAAERCTIQVLATTYLGARRDISQQVAAYVRNTTRGPATLVAHGTGFAPGDAAFANATMCHADFRDDSHSQSQSHPGVTVIPAALAAAELLGRPLPPGTIGSAVAAGYQVIGRLGRLGAVFSTERGFRASAIYTVFGAAAATAVVLGLDKQQLTNALALAAHNACGLNQPFIDGTDDWILLPGQAARAGFSAALLAREGTVGAPRVLEGELGFFRAYAGLRGLEELETGDAAPYEIEVTRLKTVLTCGWNQASTNAVLGSGVPLDDITEVEVTLSPEAHDFPGVANHGPFRTYTEAVLSARYALSTLLRTGQLEATSYDDVTDPAVVEAAKRIAVNKGDGLHGYDTEVRLVRTDGSAVELKVPGDEPQWLLTTPAVIESLHGKFDAAELDRTKVDALAAAVRPALEGTDVAELMGVLKLPA